jgi:predicted RNA polymerase sigma factor
MTKKFPVAALVSQVTVSNRHRTAYQRALSFSQQEPERRFIERRLRELWE